MELQLSNLLKTFPRFDSIRMITTLISVPYKGDKVQKGEEDRMEYLASDYVNFDELEDAVYDAKFKAIECCRTMDRAVKFSIVLERIFENKVTAVAVLAMGNVAIREHILDVDKMVTEDDLIRSWVHPDDYPLYQ